MALSDGESRRPIRGPLRTYLSRIWRRRRLLTVMLIALLLSIGLLEASFVPMSAAMQGVLVNLGSSFLGVVATVLVLEPLIERSRTPEEIIHAEFPHQLFLDGVATARRTVRVMGAWPYVMDHPWRARFLAELRQAAGRGVHVQILILDPESKAAEQRARDLDNQFDVAVVIGEVLQTLDDLRAALPPRDAEALDVRIYSSLPPARMYRWDGRAVSSFFPMGNWVGSDIKHYETNMNSRLAQFVDDQFELIWRDPDTVRLAEHFTLALDIATPEADLLRRTPQYVAWEETLYVAAHGIDVRYPDPQVRVDRPVRGVAPPTGPWSLLAVDDPALLATLRVQFHRKYGPDSALEHAPAAYRIGVSPTDLAITPPGSAAEASSSSG